jgi:hypothetical protein
MNVPPTTLNEYVMRCSTPTCGRTLCISQLGNTTTSPARGDSSYCWWNGASGCPGEDPEKSIVGRHGPPSRLSARDPRGTEKMIGDALVFRETLV